MPGRGGEWAGGGTTRRVTRAAQQNRNMRTLKPQQPPGPPIGRRGRTRQRTRSVRPRGQRSTTTGTVDKGVSKHRHRNPHAPTPKKVRQDVCALPQLSLADTNCSAGQSVTLRYTASTVSNDDPAVLSCTKTTGASNVSPSPQGGADRAGGRTGKGAKTPSCGAPPPPPHSPLPGPAPHSPSHTPRHTCVRPP
jgi:hypothetical protein